MKSAISNFAATANRNGFHGDFPARWLWRTGVALWMLAAGVSAEAQGAFSAAGSFTNARFLHRTVLLNDGRVLLVGGTHGGGAATALGALYDPSTNAWTALSGAPQLYHFDADRLADGRVLVAGGNSGGSALSSAQLFDPATDTFATVASMSTGRQKFALVALNDGRCLAAGGWANGLNHLATATVYDPVSNIWSNLPNMSVEHGEYVRACRLVDGRVLVTGGWTNTAGVVTAVAEIFNPATNTWSAAASMGTPRADHDLVLLSDGRVLAIGGDTGSGRTNTTEIYDPAANTWTAAASTGLTRQNPTATLLGDGKVLLAGGNDGSFLSSTEIYDPGANTWSAGSAMGTARWFHAAALLADGDVLVSGGYDGNPLASAERYDGPVPAPPAQAPSGTDRSVPAPTGVYSFTLSDFGFTDADVPPDDFVSVRIATLPGNGSLTVAGAPVTAGQEISVLGTDAGVTWSDAPGLSNLDGLSSALSSDGGIAAFGIWGGGLRISNDGGATWTARLTDKTPVAIAVSGDGLRLVAAMRQDQIQVSTDAGATWTPRENSRDWSDVAVSSDGLKIVAAFYSSSVQISSDGGVTWSNRPIPGSSVISAVATSSDGLKLIASDLNTGRLYTSTDSGVNWTARESNRAWAGVASSADGTVLMATVAGGAIYTSTDSGATWTARDSARSWGRVQCSADGTTAIATVSNAFDSGNVYTSSDSGATWVSRLSGKGYRSPSVSANGARMLAPAGQGAQAVPLQISNGGPAALPVWNGTLSTSFTFQVRDNGSTANGGVNLDPTPNTMSIVVANTDPSDITLSASTVAENQPAEAVVGALSATDPDPGQSHTFSLAAGAGDTDNGAFDILGNSLRLTGSADFETKASYQVRIQTSDSEGGTYSKAFTVTVTNVNEPPTDIALSSSTLPENNGPGAEVGALAALGDPDALATHTFSLVAGAGDTDNGAFQIAGNSLRLAGSANFEAKSGYSIRIQADDGLGGGFAKSFAVTITDVNEPATDIGLSNATVAENGAANAVVGVLTALNDPDAGATHTFALAAGTGDTDNGAFNLLGDQLRLSAGADFETKSGYSVRVAADDGGPGGVFAKAFTVTVTDVNEDPTITAIGNPTIDEDEDTGALAFTVGDPEGALTVAAATSNAALAPLGAISISPVSGGPGARTVTVTPLANQFGSATITLTVTDPGGLTATSAFDLTVSPVNDAPTVSDISDQAVSIGGNTGPISFSVGDVETAAGTLAVTASSSNETLLPPSGIALGGADGARTIALTPAAGMTGNVTVTVTVSDGDLSASDSFVLAVSNGAPTLGAIADQNVDEDGATGALAFTVDDAETPAGDLAVTAASDNPALVPVSAIVLGGSGGNRTVTVTPAANGFGAATITLTVSDGQLTASRSFVLNVAPVNDPPTISDIADRSTDEDTPAGPVAFTIADLETDAASLAVSAATGNAALLPLSGIAFGGMGENRTVTLTPAANQFGSATVTITVDDGTESVADSFVLTVNAVNDAPEVAADAAAVSAGEGSEATATGTFSDAEGAAGVTLTASLGAVTKDDGAGTWTWRHTPADGPASPIVTITATDNGAPMESATASFTLNVANVAPAYDLGPDADLPPPSGDLSRTVNFTDPGDDTWTGTVDYGDGTPAGALGIDAGAKTFSLGHTYTESGTYVVSVSLSDGDGPPTAHSFNVTAVLNLAPTAVSLSQSTVAENGSPGQVVGLLSATDPDAGQTHSFALVPGAGGDDNAAFSIVGNELRLVAAADFETTPTLGVRVRATDDGSPAFSVEQAFTITVTNVNEPPTADGQGLSTAEDTPLAITLTGDDPDAGAMLSFSVAGQPAHGTLAGSGASLTYTPAENYFGPDSFTFRVSDGALESDPATVTINVTPVNDPPLVDALADLTLEATGPGGAVAVFNVTGTDIEDGAIAGAGVPASGATFPLGTTAVTTTVTDSGGLSATGAFDVTVRDTIAPELTPPADVTTPATSPAGAAVNYGMALATDAVTASPDLLYSHPSGGTFPIGETVVTVTATDAAGNATMASFTVTVGPGLPVLGTPSASGITEQAATLAGTVLFDGGAGLTERGFLFAKGNANPDPMPGGAGVLSVAAPASGVFSAGITFAPGSHIAFRSFAAGEGGTAYSPVANFTAPPSVPTVSAGPAAAITYFSADLSGNVDSDGGGTISSRGFVVSATPDPRLGGPGAMTTAAGTGPGAFGGTVSGLQASTVYYARAFATNESGTSHSAMQAFRTGPAPPVVGDVNLVRELASIVEVSSIVTGVAQESGFVYGSDQITPTLENAARVVSPVVTGPANARITGLQPLTYYSVRAYAIGAGTVVYSPVRVVRTRDLTDLYVQIGSVSRPYGADNPPIPIVLSGLQNGDNLTATAVTSADRSSKPGQYPVTAAFTDPGKVLGNYRVVTPGGTLTVTPAPSTVTGKNVTVVVNPANPTVVPLEATVTSAAGVVGQGEVRFQIKNGGTNLGAAVVGAVANGSAAVDYPVPAGTADGVYTLEVSFSSTVHAPSSSSEATVALVPPGGAVRLIGMPERVASGRSFSFLVAVFQPDGQIDRNFNGTVGFRCSDDRAVLPGDVSFNPFLDQGRKRVTITLRRVGGTVVRAFKTATGEGESKAVTVTPKMPGTDLLMFPRGLLEPVPLGNYAEPIQSLAAGLDHSLMVKDGEVFSWGSNSRGQLGPSTGSSGMPGALRPSLTGIVQVSAGMEYSLALHEDGTVYAWGRNDLGQLGNGAQSFYPNFQPSPVKDLTNVVSIAALKNCGVAVKADGSLWVWGLDPVFNRLELVPARRSGGQNLGALFGGENHGLVLDNAGHLLGFGANYAGRLGPGGGGYPVYPPVGIGPNPSGAAAGVFHSMALDAEGRVWNWGLGQAGQILPYQSYYPVLFPDVRINGQPGKAVSIAASALGSAAVTADGKLLAWGAGYGPRPADLTGGREFVSVASGGVAQHFLALAVASPAAIALTADRPSANRGEPSKFRYEFRDSVGDALGYEYAHQIVSSDPDATIGGQRLPLDVKSAGGEIDVVFGRPGRQEVTVRFPNNPALRATASVNIGAPTQTYLAAADDRDGDSWVFVRAAVVSPNATVNGGGVYFHALHGDQVIGFAGYAISNGFAGGWMRLDRSLIPAGTTALTLRGIYTGSAATGFFSSVKLGTLVLADGASAAPNGPAAEGLTGAFAEGTFQEFEGPFGGPPPGFAPAGEPISQGETAPEDEMVPDPLTVSYSLEPAVVTVSGSVAPASAGQVILSLTDADENPVGAPLAAEVGPDGSYSADYTLPGGLIVGHYVMHHDFLGTENDPFARTQSALVVEPAAVTLTVTDAVAPYRTGESSVTIWATLGSPAGLLGEGTVTFEVRDIHGMTIGAPVEGPVTEGAAAVEYALPAALAPGRYQIYGAFAPGLEPGNFQRAFDDTHTLEIQQNAEPTTVTVTPETVTRSMGPIDVMCEATVRSESFVVNEGSATFQLFLENTPVGSPVTAPVTAGDAGATLTVPADAAPGLYRLVVSYLGTAAFLDSRGEAEFLVTDPAETRLAALALSEVAISPAFDGDWLEYNAIAANAVTEVGVIPVPLDPAATVTVNGVAVSPGLGGDPVALTGDSTAIAIVVTSSDESQSRTYTVTVQRQSNQAPTDILLDNGSGETSGALSAVDPDDGQQHVFELVPGTGDEDNAAFVVDGNSISLTLEALVERKETYHLRVRATDNGDPALAFEKELVMTVADPNDAPRFTSYDGAANVQISVPENASLAATVAAEDPDFPVQRLTYTLDGPDSASLGVDAGGKVSFLAPPDFETPGDVDMDGVYRVTVTVTDSGDPALSATQALEIRVTGLDEAPVAKAVAASTLEDSAGVTVTLDATDPEGSDLEYSIVSPPDPAEGRLDTVTGNSVVFHPAPNFFGGAIFTYRASDGSNDSLEATVTVTVDPVNDAPAFSLPKAKSVPAGQAWVERGGDAPHRTIAMSDDGLKLAMAHFGGQIYTSTDGGETWIPRAGAGLRNWVSIAMSADGAKLAAAENGGQIYLSTDGGVTWAAAAAAGSRDWISVAASADGMKLVAAEHIGHLYVSADGGATWAESGNSDFWTSVASSADGAKLAAVATGDRQIHRSADGGTTWTAAVGAGTGDWTSIASSDDGMTLAAVAHGGQIRLSTDGGATWTARESARTWVSVAMSADGAKLLAAEQDGLLHQSTDGGETWEPRESARTWTAVASSADGTRLAAVVFDGKIYTSREENSSAGVEVTAGSGPFIRPGFAFDISPGPVNEAGQTVSFEVSADADGLFAVPPAIDETGKLTFIPGTMTGTATVTVTARDNGGTDRGGIDASEPRTFAIAIVNGPPTLSHTDDQDTSEDFPIGPFSFTVGDAETAPGDLVVTAVSANQTLIPDANLTLGGGGAERTLTILPAADRHGMATITISVTDGVHTVTDDFTVSVAPVNDPPTFALAMDAVTVEAGSGAHSYAGFATGVSPGPDDESAQTVSFEVRTNDDTLFAAVPAIAADGTLSFTPGAAAGSATVTVTARDSGGTANGGMDTGEPRTFTLTVTAGGGAPPAFADRAIPEDGATDPIPFTVGEGAMVTVRSGDQTLVPDANLTLGGSGTERTLTIHPATDRHGAAAITVSVTEGAHTVERTFTLTVIPVNDAPTFTLPDGEGDLPPGEAWTPYVENHKWSQCSITSSADGSRLAAVAYGGQIHVSSDFGATWTARESKRSWQSIASSADGSRLAAVAYGGEIGVSSDSGETWTARESNRDWLSIASSADGSRLAAVAYGGQIHVSSDSGETWTARESNRDWLSIASSADGSRLAAVAYGGQIHISSDFGVTWTARERNRLWESIASSADGSHLAAVEDRGQIHVSSNFGETWMARESDRRWFSIASSADGSRLAAVEYGGQIHISSDFGATWTAQESDRLWVSIASSADGSHLAAVEYYGGQIHVSSDSGATWAPRSVEQQNWSALTLSGNDREVLAAVYNGTPHQLDSRGLGPIAALSGTGREWVGVARSADGQKQAAIAGGGGLWHSEDAGQTWLETPDPGGYAGEGGGGRNWTSIAMSGAGVAVAADFGEGSDGGFLFRLEGGSLVKLDAAGRRPWESVACSTDGQKLLAAESGGHLHLSTDGGATWSERLDDETRHWRAVASSADGERLMAAEFGGRIYVSTDSGATWKAREFDRDWNSVSMSADGLTLGATVHFGQIYLSTDGGETWRVREAGTDRFWTALAISADGARMAAAEYEGSLYFSEATPAPHRVTVHAGAGAFTRAGFATEILAGPPDEVAAPQAVSFQVTAADESLFDELPAIDAAGALTFTPGDRAGQTAVTVVARDDGGIEDGGIDRSAPKTFTVVVLAGPEIEVSGNGEEIPSGAAAPAEANGTDFGDVLEPGDTTVSQTFVIRNTGGDPLSITDLAVEGTHALEFSLKGFDLAVLPVVLGPGEETTFTIDFDPAGPGERVATVRIDSDDADEYPYTFALRGNGVPPGVRATPHAFAENNAPGATVARLDTIGAGSATGFAYTLEAGDGDTDNARFTVAGDELRLAESADFEAKASYSLRVRAADGMRELENPIRLVVTNANEPPRFTPGDDVGVGGGVTAPQTVANWATGIDDGDSTAEQALSFETGTDNDALFLAPPAIAPDGTLTFTPTGETGSATVNVVLTDDDSLDGAALSTEIASFVITVGDANRDRRAPVVRLTAPSSKTRTVDASFDIAGTVSDDSSLASLEVKVNGRALKLDGPLAFTPGEAMPWSVTGAKAENGPNRVEVIAIDGMGHRTRVVKTVNHWNERPELAGVYQAWMKPEGTPANEKTGLVTVNLTARGAFSGTVVHLGRPSHFRGVLDNEGHARFYTSRTAIADEADGLPLYPQYKKFVSGDTGTIAPIGILRFAVTDPTAAARTHTVSAGENLFRIARLYDVTLQAIALANHISNVANIHAGQVLTIPVQGETGLTGTIDGPPDTNGAAGTRLAAFQGHRAPHGKTNPVPDAFLNRQSRGKLVKGVYNVVFGAKDQTPALDSAKYPRGDGFAVLSLGTTGTLSLRGQLADGTKFMTGALLRLNHSAAIHAPLYRAAGSLGGELLFADQPDTDLSATDLLWIAPANARAARHVEGWPNGIRVDLAGTQFTPPASLDFGQGATRTDGGNAEVVLDEGQLTTNLVLPVNVDPVTGKATYPATPARAAGFSLKLDGRTGQFGGTFIHENGARLKYQGILLNKGKNRGGFGFFLTPRPNGESGGVGLQISAPPVETN